MTSFDRRYLLKLAGAAPLLAYLAARDAAEKALGAVTKTTNGDIYARIGVRPFINGRGTWTYLSGSLELPEVRAAKQAASLHFVDIIELQHAVSRRLAELSGAEAGMITSGAAGAMAAATAACIAGSDPARIWQLPDTTGLKHEVVMHGGRSAFDSAIRLAGGKLVLAREESDVRAAIGENTAMIYTTSLGGTLERVIAIAKQTRTPLLLDDAAGIPPLDNLKLYAKMGVDLYCFSGGKGLCAPQCSGLLLGRQDLVEAAMLNTSPWEGAVCRAMKVGKEEIMGCLAAVEAWTKMDLAALNRQWNERAVRIRKLVDTVPGVKTEIRIPEDGNRYPTLEVSWDEEAWAFTVADCDKKLRAGEPRIEVLTSNNPSLVPAVREGYEDPKAPKSRDRLEIVSMTLQPGEDLIVGQRLREILRGARSQRAATRLSGTPS
ncbi:MAG TPA: aminotransferase class V-fold PLP-dependent enzyme [Bryobacteraceae bacterium]|jgi:L-seryl-tRNA(Ser) seleniumtransferase|nr:aminotransferase class V-fold PLP-dependent enzyme [Bryobacteraceae bacterium]